MAGILDSCCRVCLGDENVMISTFDRIDNFDLSIRELLYDLVKIKISMDDNNPKFICEDCVYELALVAKFHEKCRLATDALERIRTKSESKQMSDVMLNVEIIDSATMKAEESTGGHLLAETGLSDGQSDIDGVEYIAEPYPQEGFDYVIIDDNPVEMESLDDAPNDDGIIEETEDDMAVVTEYYCPESEENGNDTSVVSKVETVEEISEEVEGIIRTQIERAKRRKIEFGSPSTTTKMNINHFCKMCGAGFAQLTNLTRHLRMHGDNLSGDIITCGNCGKHFTDVSYLYTHLNEDNCVQSKANEQQMKATIRSSHDNNKAKRSRRRDHICKYCDKGFSSSSLLLTHIRVHTGEKPFNCQICTKKFATQGGLDLHVRRHSGYKPYRCVECKRGFAESSNLKVHMRIHTGEKPHKCTICDRSFSRVFLLQIHQRTHTGERPYTCNICEKAFAQQGDLASHKRIHTGERPHTCKICSKGFIKSSGLTQHMRRHQQPKNIVPTPTTQANVGDNDSNASSDGNIYVFFDG